VNIGFGVWFINFTFLVAEFLYSLTVQPSIDGVLLVKVEDYITWSNSFCNSIFN